MKKASRVNANTLPSRDDLVRFIRSEPGQVGTREIARAFGLKNAERAALRQLLRQLADEGVIAQRGKRIHHASHLPPVVLVDIAERDTDGDLIAVPAEWDGERRGAPPRIRVVVSRRSPGPTPGLGDRALLRIERRNDDHDDDLQGRIIKVLDRARTRVLGIFRALPQGGGRMIPIDKKNLGREIAIAADATRDAKDGDLVAVEPIRGRTLGLPFGRITERLGSLKSERAVSMIAIAAHEIPAVFPHAAIAEAQAARPTELEGREDWRALPLVTIDPADAKDHDDAVHAAPDESPANRGGFIVTVAIADVADYVRPGSALDREAVKRGNSVYFPDRVVPMLPERISNDLCSLKPGEARGALAVRLVVGADGRKRSHSFHRILMRSAAKLHYAQAQAAIDGRPDDVTGPLLDPIIRPLYAAYHAVKRARDDRAPLDLDLPERKILLAADGTVDRVVVPERLDAHRLIEEFMILANVAAAETLETAKSPLIYRVHDEPTLEKVSSLRDFLKTLDITLAKTGALRPAIFNRILDQVKGREAEQLVNEVILRAQAQAEYSSENYGHFGLNLRRYAHFTSPIRRYADLVVHRALIRALRLGPGGLGDEASVESLNEIAAAISVTERRAMRAERETVDRLIAHHLADRVGATFGGRIAGVTRAGLFVKLDETGADGFVPARSLGDDYFRYDESRHAMIGDRSGIIHRLGDPVTVRLVDAIPVAGALRFELLSEARGARARPRPRSGERDRGRDDVKPPKLGKHKRAPQAGKKPRGENTKSTSAASMTKASRATTKPRRPGQGKRSKRR